MSEKEGRKIEYEAEEDGTLVGYVGETGQVVGKLVDYKTAERFAEMANNYNELIRLLEQINYANERFTSISWELEQLNSFLIKIAKAKEAGR